MQLPVLAIVGAIAAIVCIVVCLQVLEARRTATRRDAFSREAAQRGWRYACTTEGGTRTDRFEGTSLAGSWTAEVIERRGRKRPGVRLMRWWNARADAPPPAAGPFVLVERERVSSFWTIFCIIRTPLSCETQDETA